LGDWLDGYGPMFHPQYSRGGKYSIIHISYYFV
jgi:hypothetical protein